MESRLQSENNQIRTLSILNTLKGHSHAVLVHFKNQKYVLTSMNTHK